MERDAGERDQDLSGARLCLWGGSFPSPQRLGKISSEKCQELGMKCCLFSWHIYSGWVNKWWGRVPAVPWPCPPWEHTTVGQFSL